MKVTILGLLLCYLSLLTIRWGLDGGAHAKVLRTCETDPLAYLNINRTTLASRQSPRSVSTSTAIVDQLASIVQRWMPPECFEESPTASHARSSAAGSSPKVFKDTPRSAQIEKPLTKLDQGILEDLIWRAGSAGEAESPTIRRRKRSLSGNFTISTYLRARESPYEVISDLSVPEGVTVNVEKGVELRFRPSLGLTVRGRLVARGTRDDPILMEPLVENTRWKGLTFETPFKPYDLRLTGGQGRSDGYLETYDGNAWRLVCFQGWTRTSGDVACKQLGFAQGASPELPALTAPSSSKSYWLSNVDCSGSEVSLKDCRSSQATTSCQRPITLRCLGDTSNENTTQKVDTSILEYVNVSDSETGIVVKSTSIVSVPIMNFVTAQNSLNHGLFIDMFYTPDASRAPPRLYKCLWINNRVTGLYLILRHPPRDGSMTFVIEESLATVGGGDGIKIEGRGNVHIIRSAAFGNAHNGIDVRLDSGSIRMNELVVGANSGVGVNVVRGGTTATTDRLTVSMSDSKISGHWAAAAASFDTTGAPNCDYSIERNEFWENYDGCILFPSAVKKSAVEIVGNNFTRNRGAAVRLASFQRDVKARLENNLFHLNILTNHSDRGQAAVRIALDAGDGSEPSSIQVMNNRFTKNTMHDCLSIQSIRPNSPSTPDSLVVRGNRLAENLVTTTMFVDILEANISSNTFDNPLSQCELRTGVARDSSRIDARHNYWGSTDEASVRKRICDGASNRSLAVADARPWSMVAADAAGQPPPTESLAVVGGGPVVVQYPSQNLVGAQPITPATAEAVIDNQPSSVAENYEISGTGKPYSVAQNLLVSPKSTLTIAPGAVLEFDTDRGLRVQGTIIAKGTEDEPIIFRAALGRTWNGIMFENKNSPTSVLEHCIIDGARIGLSLNADKLAMHRCIVSNSLLNGITITDDSGERVDLGDSTILNSQDIGLRIANRNRPVEVLNFNVDNTGGNGIDFDHPVANASFVNARLSNSRRYALHVDQMMSSRQSLSLRNCTIVNQNGVGGVYLVARDYGRVAIANTVFANNNARSLIVDLKCNFTGDMPAGQPSRFQLVDSRFENNNDNVVDIHLAFCSDAEIARNTFLSNNRDHRYGVFHLQLDPLQRPITNPPSKVENFRVEFGNNLFRQNGGEFSAYMLPMSMDEFTGIVRGNRFVENENRRSVLVMGSPLFRVDNNEFDNRRSTYNLEAEYNDAKLLDATNNYWGTVRESEIHDTVFDGTKIPYRGTVKFVPYLLRGSGGGVGGSSVNGSATTNRCDRRASCHGNGDCVSDQICACFPGYFGDECEQFNCRDLNECTNNGRCVGSNRCQCFNGWTGDDCRVPLCVTVANCSSHGECVSLNECQCETGWTSVDCSIQNGQGANGTTGGGRNNTSGAVVAGGVNSTNIGGQGGVANSSTNIDGGQGGDIGTNASSRRPPTGTTAGTRRPTVTPSGGTAQTENNTRPIFGTSEPGTQCPNQCSGHGRCLRGNVCECETGWLGSSCLNPDCIGSRNCSGHGSCIGPGRCECEQGYAGATCGVCVKNSTNEICQVEEENPVISSTPGIRTIRTVATFSTLPPSRASTLPTVECVQICEHGFCDTSVGECQCYAPWTGPNCDQCSRASCEDTGIRFVSPDSAPASMAPALASEFYVRIVGTNFTRSANNRYACRYGAAAVIGVWLSTTDLECPVPPNQAAGAVTFSVAPLSTDEIDSAAITDGTLRWILAPTSFTFYSSCGAVSCGENGFCFRGSCYCSSNGITEPGTCDESTTPKPSIDTNSLNAFTQGATKELEPASVQLKTKEGGNLIRWELVDGPIGAAINAATGLLVWSQPRGSSESTKFTVAARAPNGADSISWSVTVPMTYQPVIDRLLNSTNGNGTITVKGHVDRVSDATDGLSVPVKLVVYKNGQQLQEWETWTDAGSGHFQSTYSSPSGDGGQFGVVSMHPGNQSAKLEGSRASGTYEWAVQAFRVFPRDQTVQYEQRERANVLITVENLGTVELHIAEISFKSIPSTLLNISRVTVAGTNTQLSPTYPFQPRTNTTLNVELILYTSISDDRSLSFEIVSREIASPVRFSIRLKRSASGPWLSAVPSNLRYALVYGEPWPTSTMTVTNDGRATARNLIIQLTSDSFVDVVNVFKNGASIINNRTFDLAPGESVQLALTIAPPAVLGTSGGGSPDLTGRTFNGNVTVDFVSREPTLYPLIIPFVIEFRTNSMIDRFNVSVFAEASRTTAAIGQGGDGGSVPVPAATVSISNPFLERNKTTSTDANGIAVFTNVPTGFYLLTIEKTGYVPFQRVLEISLEQPGSYRATLDDYFTAGGQQNGADVQLVQATAGGSGKDGGFQLQTVANAPLGIVNGSSPYLELNPIDLALPLDNVSETDRTLIVRNLGGTSAVGFSMATNDSRLPVMIESDTLDIPNGESRTVRLTIRPNPGYRAPAADQQCDAYLLSFYYDYQTGRTNGTEKATLLVKNSDGYATESIRLCEIDPIASTSSSSSPPSHAVGLLIRISCDCRPSIMRQCLATYDEQPLAVCGPPFASIANSSSDPASLFQLLVAVATCNSAKLNLDKGREAVGCLINIQDACAGTQKVWRSRWRRDAAVQTSTSRFFDQLQLAHSVSDRLGHPFGQIFPFLLRDSIQNQAIENLRYFDRWFGYVGQILGTPSLHIPTDTWFAEFTRSISDTSDLSEALSDEEMNRITATLSAANARQRPIVTFLLERWNATITRGRRKPSSEGQSSESSVIRSQNVAPYDSLQELVSTTNVMNALATAQGFPNNFLGLLDREMNDLRYSMLESEGTADCLSALIKIEPAELDEGERLTLQLTLKNLLNNTAIQINELTPHFRPVTPDDSVLVTFNRADTKYPGTVMDPVFGQYAAYWNVETNLRQRLTKSITFRVDLLIVYTQTGLRTQTQTKIQSLPFTVRPRASLRVLYFLYAPIPITDGNQQPGGVRRRPNVLVALMNNGYRDLANLTIAGARLRVTENSEKGPVAPFRLDYVRVNGREAPNSFDVRIPSLRSGEVTYVEYALSSSAAGRAQLNEFLSTVFVDGEFLRSETQETFRILQWLNGTSAAATHPDSTAPADSTGGTNLLLGVQSANGVQPAYLYNAETTLLAPINEAELVGTSEGWEVINDRSYFHIRLQYRQNLQSARAGALYGEYGLPPSLNDTNELLLGSRSNMSLDSSHMWISYGGVRGADPGDGGGGRVLNFVDPITPSNQDLLTYEFVFGPPNTEPPEFVERSLTFNAAPADGTASAEGTVIGRASAIDPDGGNVTYGLYGGDGRFIINPKTGEIKINRIPSSPDGTRRACLNVRATDDGLPIRTTFIPVEITYEEAAEENGVTESPCSLLSNLDLMPNYVERVAGDGRSSTAVTGQAPTGSRGTAGPTARPTAGVPEPEGRTTVESDGAEEGGITSTAVAVESQATTVVRAATTASPGEAAATSSAAENIEYYGEYEGGASTTVGEELVEGEASTEANGGSTNAVGSTSIVPSGSGTAGSSGGLPVSGGPATTTVASAITSVGSEPTANQTGGSSVPSGGTETESSIVGVSSATSGLSGGSEPTAITVSASGSESTDQSQINATAGNSNAASGQSGTTGSASVSGTVSGTASAVSQSPNVSESVTGASGAIERGTTVAPAGILTSSASSGGVPLDSSSGTGVLSASTSPAAGSNSSSSSPAAVSIAQNEDGLVPTAIAVGTTVAPPVSNPALPAQAITPGFLPPDLLRGLGNEVNVTNLSTDDLVMLACKLRGAQPIKPIWGIICDLGKAGAGGTTSKPSSSFKRLLDQIGG